MVFVEIGSDRIVCINKIESVIRTATSYILTMDSGQEIEVSDEGMQQIMKSWNQVQPAPGGSGEPLGE